MCNFGGFATPERSMNFDIDDFDETLPAPWEWDVKRLATSLVLAARSLGLSDAQQGKICRRGVRAYGEAMAEFAAMPALPMWVARLPLERLIDQRASANLRCHLERVTAGALRRTSRQAVRKLCESDGSGGLRFRHQPPLIWRFEALPPDVLAKVNTAANQALADADIKDRLSRLGIEPVGGTPAQFTQMLASDMAKWKRIISERKITLE